MTRLPIACLLTVWAAVAAAHAGPRAPGPAPPSPAPASAHAAVPVADDPVAVQRNWWKAYSVGDVKRVRALSLPSLTLTIGSGRTMDLAGALALSASYDAVQPPIAWSAENVQHLGDDVAVVTSAPTETLAGRPIAFRYITVLAREGPVWKVAATQTTRLARWNPRVAPSDAGDYADFAGRYAAATGAIVTIAADGGALVLTDPKGGKVMLDPIGPSLFETRPDPEASDSVRVVFVRDGGGKVRAMLRLSAVIVATFPRIP